MSSFQSLTFVGHHVPCLHVHLGAPGSAHLMHLISHLVAAVFATAQTHSLVEDLSGAAAVSHALLLHVHQRVNEQVDGALMGTFYNLVHVW